MPILAPHSEAPDAASFAQTTAGRSSQRCGSAGEHVQEAQKFGDKSGKTLSNYSGSVSCILINNASYCETKALFTAHLAKKNPSRRFSVANDGSFPNPLGHPSTLPAEIYDRQRSRSLSRASELKLACLASAALHTGKDQITGIDSDRLDKACGLGPATVIWGTSTTTAVNPSTKGAPQPVPGKDAAMHVEVPREQEAPATDSIAANKRASKYPAYQYPDIREVMKSLNLILRSQGQKMRDYIEVEEMVEAREKESEADPNGQDETSEQQSSNSKPCYYRIFTLH